MPDEYIPGDHIDVGDVKNAQGVAIGRGAFAQVTGGRVSGDIQVDLGAVRSALGDLHESLAAAELDRDVRIAAQTAVGKALAEAGDGGDNETILARLRTVGETLQQANLAVNQGSALWNNVARLSMLLAPLAGGARIVASWFGIALP